jgi:hypothetical protein
VRIESSIEPSAVEVDGKQIGPAPVELDATPGAHSYKVTSPGYLVQEGSFDAQPGDKLHVRVAMAPARSPLGLRIEPYFSGHVVNLADSPLGRFSIGTGVRLFHQTIRFAGIQAGMQFEVQSRELNRFAFGPVFHWCPDRFKSKRGAAWCPLNLGALKTSGGEVGPFTGGENSLRLATAGEMRFDVLFFRFAAGIGMEEYKRNALVSLSGGVTFFEVSVGMDL